MGFLDKIQDGLNQGQQKLDAVQNKKQIDGHLTNLGKWVYATRTGQDGGRGEAEIDIALQQITALVGQFGMFDLPFPTPGGGGGTTAGAPPASPSGAFPADPEAPPPGGFPAAPSGGAPGSGGPPVTGGMPPGMGSGPPGTGGAPPGTGGALPGTGGAPPGMAAPVAPTPDAWPPASEAPPVVDEAPAPAPDVDDDLGGRPDAPPSGFGGRPPGGG